MGVGDEYDDRRGTNQRLLMGLVSSVSALEERIDNIKEDVHDLKAAHSAASAETVKEMKRHAQETTAAMRTLRNSVIAGVSVGVILAIVDVLTRGVLHHG